MLNPHPRRQRGSSSPIMEEEVGVRAKQQRHLWKHYTYTLQRGDIYQNIVALKLHGVDLERPIGR